MHTYAFCSFLTLLLFLRACDMGGCLDQFEAPEEVDQARLKFLQMWTEKRLDTVVITMPSKDRDLYRLLCKANPSYQHLFTFYSLITAN